MERQNRNLNVEACVRIVVLAEEGHTQQEIAQILGTAQSSVSRVLRRFRETGNYSRRPGQGRPRATTNFQDRFIRLVSLRERFVTARNIQNRLLHVHQLRISTETIRKRLREHQLRPRRPATGPALTVAHRRARLVFAQEPLHWRDEDWSRVLFSDESKFCLWTNDRRTRVYRRTNERYAQCNIIPTTLFGGGSIMVWGGISNEARTELEVFHRVRLTGASYVERVIEPHVMPFAGYIGENFQFMQDNAKPHTARLVQEYLHEVGITTMNWPARSPDLNPIEDLWDTMGRQVRASPRPPTTI